MISFSSNLRNSLFWESSHTLLKSSKLEFIFSLLRNIHLLPIILTEGDVWAALENKTLSLSLEGDNSASTTQIYPEMQGTHARDKLAFLLCWLRHPHITQHQSSSQTLKQCANSKSAIKKKKKKAQNQWQIVIHPQRYKKTDHSMKKRRNRFLPDLAFMVSWFSFVFQPHSVQQMEDNWTVLSASTCLKSSTRQ